MNEQEKQKIIKELATNPKIQKAIKGILAPLKQKGDSISFEVEGEEKVEIKFEDL